MATGYLAGFRPRDGISQVVKDSQGNLEEGINVADAVPIENVTQVTNINTTVVTNAQRGKIFLQAQIGASTFARFQVQNPYAVNGAHVSITVEGRSLVAFLPLNWGVWSVGGGAFNMIIENVDGANATEGVPVVHYEIHRP